MATESFSTQLQENKGQILVVDDNPFNSDILSRLLEHKGYGVAIVTNGHHALDMVRKEGFDLVLLDVMMPGMNGIEVLKEMRRLHSGIELPIIMLTALTDNDRIVAAFAEGADDYITRPIDLSVAMARIEAQLRLRDQARGQVGELHKIGGVPRARPRASRFYCANCLSCHTNYATQCVICKQPAPSDGWPRIDESEFNFLGQTVGGRYFLEQFVGKGSVGQVYRAWDIDLGRDFAIKIIDFEQAIASHKEGLRNQTVLEVEALVRLENPYVVKIYQVLQLEGETYALVMDYIRGFTLEAVLDEHGPMAPWLVLDVVRQVALALHSAHAVGILHRDVKPGNIMLEGLPTGEYFVRLLDFGIVQMLDRPMDNENICGTPAYISPEQILGEQALDVRADIYSLGAVMYHMLVGHAPFEDLLTSESGPGNSEIMLQLQHQLYSPLPPLPRTLQPSYIVDPLNTMLQRMMAKDRDKRHQDISEVLEQIMAMNDSL